jgi:hypothetical protein
VHKKDGRARKRGYSQSEVEDALAGLIASTKRIHRKLNLLQIAEKIEVARTGLGNLKNVSEAIGLSTEMLRQFSRVTKIAPEAQRFVAMGAIRSVDMADRISRLPTADQFLVAEAVARGKLNSDDVRAVISLRKNQPKLSISRIISRVTGSRNIKEYGVQFLSSAKEEELKNIKDRFSKLLGQDGISSVNVEKGLGTLILNKDGKNRLELIAKRKGLTKRALVEKVISGEVK